MRLTLLSLFLLACGGSRTAATPTPEPSAPEAPSEVAEAPAATPASLHGTPVAPPRPVTAFEGVIAHTGQPRSLDALKGHPTVVWFFPFAGTPG